MTPPAAEQPSYGGHIYNTCCRTLENIAKQKVVVFVYPMVKKNWGKTGLGKKKQNYD